jgi:hypothetical protein
MKRKPSALFIALTLFSTFGIKLAAWCATRVATLPHLLFLALEAPSLETARFLKASTRAAKLREYTLTLSARITASCGNLMAVVRKTNWITNAGSTRSNDAYVTVGCLARRGYASENRWHS